MPNSLDCGELRSTPKVVSMLIFVPIATPILGLIFLAKVHLNDAATGNMPTIVVPSAPKESGYSSRISTYVVELTEAWSETDCDGRNCGLERGETFRHVEGSI